MDDAISRKAAIQSVLVFVFQRYDATQEEAEAICSILNALPTQPERMRGEWVEDDDGWDGEIWRCSECDAVFTLNEGSPEENGYYFCPNCGADMRGEDDE